MGTYCAIKFDDIDITSTKSVLPESYVSLFQESDRLVTHDPDYEQDEINYVVSRAVIIQRLDLLGFTSEAARTSFDRWHRDEIAKYTEYSEDEEGDWADSNLALLKTFSFDAWRVSLRAALKYRYESDHKPSDPIKAMMCDTQENWLLWVADERFVLRAMLDELTDVKQITLDTAGLIQGGYIDGSEGLLDRIRTQAALAKPILGPAVIIGEGVNDTAVLRAALIALYPETKDYFSFFDHSELSVDGGASYLVKFLRAFGTARIATRLIGVFDNDAAGGEAFLEATRLRLPENIVPYKLPDIELARAYPTVGPQGLHNVDVNGRAASIELYLGRHNLTGIDGQLTPVHWSGPTGKTGNYQGAIQNKAEVGKAFLKDIRAARSTDECRERYPELVTIWSGIFSALQTLNAADAIREDKQVVDIY
jgi:hypothetical protein